MGWFKNHKVLTVVLVIVVIGVVGGALGGGKKSDDSPTSSSVTTTSKSNSKSYRFTERADKQTKDVEVLPGEPATVDSVKMTLSGVEYKTKLTDYETADSGKTYVIADVALENVGKETQAYNVFDFRIQTAGGQVLDGTISTLQNLGSGDLVAGGKMTGKVVFEVPVEEGHQYMIWKPNAFNSDRAIVQIR
jgi:hypothetical protein